MRRLSITALVLCALLLGGCAVSPPDDLMRGESGGAPLLSASATASEPERIKATLYFRYGDTAYLAAEEREVLRGSDETLEKAIVRALVAGPSAGNPSLTPLFPAGVEVISATRQGDLLHVMFSEELLGRYADEVGAMTTAHRVGEAPLRRKLAMDALAATLTGAGLCSRVQVLIWRQAQAATTLRLPSGYLSMSDDETPLDPFTRDESVILTAHNAASALLSAWMTQDWPMLYGFVATVDTQGVARPTAQAAYDDFAASNLLTSFSLSPGDVSSDGKRCVLVAELSVRTRGGEDGAASGLPICLTCERGLWKMEYSRLRALMGGE